MNDEPPDALRHTGAYFRSLVEASTDCVRVLTLDGTVEYMNRNGQKLLEIDDFTSNAQRYWPELWPPSQRSRLEAALLGARQGQPSTFLGYCPTAKGSPRWWRTTVAPIIDDHGQVLRLLATSQDVTRERVLTGERSVLINELNHRVKNTLAAVQSIVSQSMRNAATGRELRDLIDGRLLTISQVHDLLTRSSWQATELTDVIDTALRASLRDGQYDLAGPSLFVRPTVAVSLAMAFHELAINARQHGVLRGPEGRVAVRSRIEGDGDASSVVMTWREFGPPAERPAVARLGFGLRLIGQALPQEIGGEAHLDWREDGLIWTIRAPAHRLSGLHDPSLFHESEAV